MPVIRSDKYGKTRVRLIRVDRSRAPHEVKELSVAILLEGDFSSAYVDGDNSNVLPTDTMKNAVYVLARTLAWDSIEALGGGIARHFLDRLSHVSQVSVEIEEEPWHQIGQHIAVFLQSGMERRTSRLIATRAGISITSGIGGLRILKTAGSAFAGFLKDELTTLPETNDRLFATVLQAEWTYAGNDLSFNELHHDVRALLLERFAEHESLSVQHTLFAMAVGVLEKIDSVTEIYLAMPNKHCLLVDLARFGLDNPNVIFVPTDEPSGYIEARIGRDAANVR